MKIPTFFWKKSFGMMFELVQCPSNILKLWTHMSKTTNRSAPCFNSFYLYPPLPTFLRGVGPFTPCCISWLHACKIKLQPDPRQHRTNRTTNIEHGHFYHGLKRPCQICAMKGLILANLLDEWADTCMIGFTFRKMNDLDMLIDSSVQCDKTYRSDMV